MKYHTLEQKNKEDLYLWIWEVFQDILANVESKVQSSIYI